MSSPVCWFRVYGQSPTTWLGITVVNPTHDFDSLLPAVANRSRGYRPRAQWSNVELVSRTQVDGSLRMTAINRRLGCNAEPISPPPPYSRTKLTLPILVLGKQFLDDHRSTCGKVATLAEVGLQVVEFHFALVGQ